MINEMKDSFNISVIGSGYVGMSLAVLLAQNHKVIIREIDQKKISKINEKQSTVEDAYIQKFFDTKNLDIRATNSSKEAYKSSDFIVIAVPTNYDPINNYFDTSIVDSVIEEILNFNEKAFIIIKSTIPVGYIKSIKKKFNIDNIVFSPEFLREGSALYDNLYPSRIIIGGNCKRSKIFADMLLGSTIDKSAKVLYVDSNEAEAIKLFSNTYLAMRVAFFNELDSYGMQEGLKVQDIIEGVCLDDRVGDGYNNPSFGYGGYCLPKDTKQLLSNFKNTPQNLIEAIINSNETRKKFISKKIHETDLNTVGFYRLVMKQGSDNMRSSASIDLLEMLIDSEKKILIYEPNIEDEYFMNCQIINDLESFKKNSDLVVANRLSVELDDIKEKVFTRDLYLNS